MATQASDTTNTANKRSPRDSGDELAVIAQRAQAFTNASGVAIALSEGNADEIICRASRGSSAPDVGTALRVEGSFTGLCIQSGKELRCDDCETDTRVDTAAIRALNIRSMVVTPIRDENRVIGVLAVFAPTPHAFTITHVAVLKTMADQITGHLQRERRAREENPQPEPPRPPAPVVTAKPVVAVPAVVPPPAPPAVVIRPAAVTPRAAAVPSPARVEPVKAPTPVEVVPLATPPRKEERRVEPPRAEAPRASFGTFDTVAGEDKKSGSRMVMIGVVAVVVIAAGATYGFLKLRKPDATAQHQTEAASVPPAQASAPSSGTVQPNSPVSNTPASTASVPSTVAPPARSAPEADSPRRGQSRSSREAAAPVTEKPVPADKPAAVATLASSGTSKIAQNNTPAQSATDVAPSFGVVGNSTPGGLSALAKPVAASTPSAASIEQSSLEQLQLIKTSPLAYPAIARARRISGVVVVQVKVGKDGKVSSPQFISGPPIFKDAAFEAVMQYQFKPARLNGQPIDQTTQIRLNFHP